MSKQKKENSYLTVKDLAEFTKEVLLPAVGRILDDKLDVRFGEFKHEMKDYIDSKMAETKGDIISFMKGDQSRDKNWKMKVVNILKRQKLAKPDEIRILTDLIR